MPTHRMPFPAPARLPLLFLALAPMMTAQEIVPEGSAADDWASVRAIYEAGRHAAVVTEEGYRAEYGVRAKSNAYLSAAER